ncbi:DUF3862 domain-containing protein [Bacillus sp. PK3_68]|uniref:DUF3862 domain-containing protein n=1 Tax=Bacillus sp. PK3_68 TaxID=2027408 RepID=UPI000E722594|nr:DUF3862 domain-containing protein [Bacillus sp. PK3_68]RJS60154.1 hypothetical protein CJ483_08820 [Bacillus sp. PK3_68]
MKKFFAFGCLGFVGLIVLAIIGIVMIGGDFTTQTSDNSNEDAQTTAADPKPAEESKKETTKLTKEKFEQIKDGMSYDEVVKIVGSEGTLLSETGDSGTEFHTQMYEFETDGFLSSANMTFQGGKLINKAQMGLGGDSDVTVSLDEFGKIENGMSYDEVTQIIGGEGEKLSESGEEGSEFHTVIYSYNGEGGLGANANFTFQGGKLMNKAQMGLK